MKRKLLLFVTLLLAFVNIYAQDNYWSFDEHAYADARPFTGQVQIEGVLQASTDIEIAAFVGDQVRAVGRLVQGPPFAPGYFIQFNINFTTAGESVTFKVYNHAISGGDIMDYCTVTLAGEPISITTGMDNPGSVTAPVVINFQHTMSLPVTAYTTDPVGGWYLITSPLQSEVSPTDVTHLVNTAGYDLYYFDQTQAKEWVNYKTGDGNVNPGFNLEAGKGYLYANNEALTLTFIGAPYSGTGTFALSYVEGHPLSGWNLVGNPYTTEKAVNKSYFRMNPENGRKELIEGTGNVGAMEGIFVYTEAAGEVSFTTPSKFNTDERIALNLNNNEGILDRVVVRFGEGERLPKLMLDESHTKIYVPQDGKDYAVVRSNGISDIPVNFKTETIGRYTFSTDIENANVTYLHLIDNLEGKDIDLLLDEKYTFNAAPTDRSNRFVLRFRANLIDFDSDIFAYQSGTDIVVAGEGTLQIFDVMGRFVGSHEINGVQAIPAPEQGVYVFRMVGNELKTQKIVVR